MLENKKRFRQLSDFQALLLSSLHITHEAITNQTKQVERQSQLEEFIGSLEQKINNAGADSISEPAEEK
jgi:cell division protein ZapA (FtsZ GTPase activity inhibitor)